MPTAMKTLTSVQNICLAVQSPVATAHSVSLPEARAFVITKHLMVAFKLK
jgi:hypothetical protein